MSILDNSRDLLLRIWNDRDMDAVAEYIYPDHVHHDPTGDTQDIDAYRAFIKMMITAFPDLRVTMREAWQEDDTATLNITLQGTHRGNLMGVPPTGKPIRVDVTLIDRHENGMIVESWREWNPNDMIRQLGG